MSDTATYMLIRSAGQILAIPSETARQVVPFDQLSPLPAARGTLLGLMAAAGRAVPVLDVPRVIGMGQSEASDTPAEAPDELNTPQGSPLALLIEVGDEALSLPVTEVIGFISDEKETFAAGSFLSEEKMLGGYSGGGHKGKFLNPQVLFQEISGRLTPV